MQDEAVCVWGRGQQLTGLCTRLRYVSWHRLSESHQGHLNMWSALVGVLRQNLSNKHVHWQTIWFVIQNMIQNMGDMEDMSALIQYTSETNTAIKYKKDKKNKNRSHILWQSFHSVCADHRFFSVIHPQNQVAQMHQFVFNVNGISAYIILIFKSQLIWISSHYPVCTDNCICSMHVSKYYLLSVHLSRGFKDKGF